MLSDTLALALYLLAVSNKCNGLMRCYCNRAMRS